MSKFILGDRVVDGAVMQDRAERAAQGLIELGVKSSDVVALFMRNDLPFIEASVAAGLVGAYPTPVNWHGTVPEARYVFEDCGAKVIVMDEPTNQLDLESITALNNGLINFKGTVLFTSQDREFVNTIATRIIEITPKGLTDKVMSYDEYLEDPGIAALREALY